MTIKEKTVIKEFGDLFTTKSKYVFDDGETHYNLGIHNVKVVGVENPINQLKKTKTFTRKLSIFATDYKGKKVRLEISMFSDDVEALKFKKASSVKLCLLG